MIFKSFHNQLSVKKNRELILTLEWVGHIPGKRESRRFEGDYILSQKDVVQQNEH